MSNAYVLLDGANIQGMIEELSKKTGRIYKLSFSNLKKIISKDMPDAWFYYIANSPGPNTFFDRIKKSGFSVLSPKQRLEPGNKWDDAKIQSLIEQAIDNNAEEILLFAGDEHYAPYLDKAISNGIKVKILGFRDNTNNMYINNSQYTFMDLNKLIQSNSELLFIDNKDINKNCATLMQVMIVLNGFCHKHDWQELISDIMKIIIMETLIFQQTNLEIEHNYKNSEGNEIEKKSSTIKVIFKYPTDDKKTFIDFFSYISKEITSYMVNIRHELVQISFQPINHKTDL